jgi:hypothetical protein
MVDFDCGRLCNGAGGGIPICCNSSRFHPLLYTEELKWLREHKKADWRPSKPRTSRERKTAAALSDHLVFADCPGIQNCNRDHRALVCRMFPFEPHVDDSGKVVAIAFVTEDPGMCPLVEMPRSTFQTKYIRASMKAWQRLIDKYPEERELYICESRKRERRALRKGIKIRLIR